MEMLCQEGAAAVAEGNRFEAEIPERKMREHEVK
jgi:hypothetical protein